MRVSSRRSAARSARAARYSAIRPASQYAARGIGSSRIAAISGSASPWPPGDVCSGVTSYHLVLVKPFAQGTDGGVQPALDRALGDAELLGDHPDGQVGVEAQHEDLPLRLGQFVQALGDGERNDPGVLAGGGLPCRSEASRSPRRS